MVQTYPPQDLMMEIEENKSSNSRNNNNNDDVEEKKEKKVNEVLPFHKLFSFADGWDWVLMALGTLGGIVHGLAQPVGYLLLGKALDAFGKNIGDTHAMVKALDKV